MRCDDVQALLPKLVDDETSDIPAERHLESCLACQAEAVRYRKMLRALGALRAVTLEAPHDLLEETLAVIGGPSLVEVWASRRRAAVAGTVGAVAAGAAATALMVARRRGLRLAAVLVR